MVDGAEFRLTVSNQDAFHVHFRNHALHYFDGAWCTGHNTGAKTRQVEVCKFWVIKLVDEHRWDAMKRRTGLLFDGPQGLFRIK